jgi:hypothetical protein
MMDMNIQEKQVESQRRRQSQEQPAPPCVPQWLHSRGSSAPASFTATLAILNPTFGQRMVMGVQQSPGKAPYGITIGGLNSRHHIRLGEIDEQNYCPLVASLFHRL